ncbi:hypothetical protein ACFGVR_17825 [Mucilaginibacter sp. AW1-3]
MIKKLLCLFILLTLNLPLSRAQVDTDSIKIARKIFIKSQTIKADSLNELALQLAAPGASSADLNKAIEHIMTGLHIYSKFSDSVGLRETFDHLGLVYHLQKKYTQAKWFILQSSAISREKKDTLNIIASLLTLASVKEDIKDFSLAKRDLDEALALAKTQPQINQQVEVLKTLAAYYTQKGDASQAQAALNRITFLRDSVTNIVAKNTKTDTSQHGNNQAFHNEGTRSKGWMIIIISLIFLAVCIALYLRSKKRNS